MSVVFKQLDQGGSYHAWARRAKKNHVPGVTLPLIHGFSLESDYDQSQQATLHLGNQASAGSAE